MLFVHLRFVPTGHLLNFKFLSCDGSYVNGILLKLQTGADDDDDMPMDVDVKDGLDVDLQKQITAAFDSNTRLLEHLVR